MSLKTFHLVFISLSTLLSVGLICWGGYTFMYMPDKNSFPLIGVGFITLVLLIPYYRWFRRKMTRLTPFLLLIFPLVTYSSNAWSCAVCFRDPNSPLSRGIMGGVFFLILLVLSLLMAIVRIAHIWSKRAALLEKE